MVLLRPFRAGTPPHAAGHDRLRVGSRSEVPEPLAIHRSEFHIGGIRNEPSDASPEAVDAIIYDLVRVYVRERACPRAGVEPDDKRVVDQDRRGAARRLREALPGVPLAARRRVRRLLHRHDRLGRPVARRGPLPGRRTRPDAHRTPPHDGPDRPRTRDDVKTLTMLALAAHSRSLKTKDRRHDRPPHDRHTPRRPRMNLFATVLTHPAPTANYRGESELNRTVIQKIADGRHEYPIVSPEAMRNALREILAAQGLPTNRRRLQPAAGEGDEKQQLAVSYKDLPDPARYVDDFIFGYLLAVKGEELKRIGKERGKDFPLKRDSVLRMNLAKGLEPYRHVTVFTQSPHVQGQRLEGRRRGRDELGAPAPRDRRHGLPVPVRPQRPRLRRQARLVPRPGRRPRRPGGRRRQPRPEPLLHGPGQRRVRADASGSRRLRAVPLHRPPRPGDERSDPRLEAPRPPAGRGLRPAARRIPPRRRDRRGRSPEADRKTLADAGAVLDADPARLLATAADRMLAA